ncbi:MAG TPA: BMP family ABC transporter substrate-binding protein [Thermotogota bacterium]|nr:BMP family ABC transporter substrate-binding protein [Thermotogota bacterium]OQC31955.1 MAG: Membrane lipoprotein TpN38(b) precursor [Thermotogota bacterium ADurb.Bin062]HNY81770.1 BMP family ABC transporter substrate-binding protein [Thermotogota bacterium]HOD91265.1 BMP family ABC transporter substrate-binding protein [Thermotogota bacterium]HOF23941.1 BMP family ABC transporter substrate-binding protein [Thermotogota bacterium]
MTKRRMAIVVALISIVSCFSFSVALMVTGEIGGNPIYEMMVSGAESASAELGFELKTVEGGYNSAKWESNLIALAATGKYDLIVTFTEGMPKSVEKAADMFPRQKFALIDGIAAIKPNVYSLGFKDEEMCYLAGYFAGLITLSDLPGANPNLTVGLIGGDTYPAMTDRMKPAFTKGARAVHPDIDVLFSVVGSWSDPKKGKDLAQAQYAQGADIILTIAGGSGVGAIQEALRLNKYIIGVDSNTIPLAPGTILACALKRADLAMNDVMRRAFSSALPYGATERHGIAEGVIGFTFDDPTYLETIPEPIRKQMLEVFDALKNGVIDPLS